MDAAMRWKEDGGGGDGTQFNDEGGQLLPLEPVELEEGSEIEVYYDQDRKWYHATVMEVVNYRDDER